jgi:hypothetical protein
MKTLLYTPNRRAAPASTTAKLRDSHRIGNIDH